MYRYGDLKIMFKFEVDCDFEKPFKFIRYGQVIRMYPLYNRVSNGILFLWQF